MARALALACLLTGAAVSAQGVPLEYQVKAAYLYNFTKFVDWPPDSFGEGDPLTICIAGRNPFGSALSTTIAGETLAGRPLRSR